MIDENEPPRTTLTDRTQVYPAHREIIKDGPRQGQQRDYEDNSQFGVGA